jgi:precorrin-6B methylase 2
MNSRLKSLVFRVFPQRAQRLQAATRRWHIWRVERRIGILRVRNAFVSRYGTDVQAGPFQGMRYVRRSTGSTIIPKLLGSYEIELGPWLREVCVRDYRVVVDIGCAEGYYAIGLARNLLSASVYAFDIDPVARRLCNEMAHLNGVASRVKVQGECTSRLLNQILVPGSLVISDCEGAEEALLDPYQVPSLKEADIIVELHDHLLPGETQRLVERFASTHTITLVAQQERTTAEFQILDFLSPVDRNLALSEMRSCQQNWAFMQAHSSVAKSRSMPDAVNARI